MVALKSISGRGTSGPGFCPMPTSRTQKNTIHGSHIDFLDKLDKADLRLRGFDILIIASRVFKSQAEWFVWKPESDENIDKRACQRLYSDTMATRINYVDLYSFYNDMDATVIASLMEGYDISCSMKTLGTGRLGPDLGAYSQEKRISVEEGKIENARNIIWDAIRNGVISRDGRFMS